MTQYRSVGLLAVLAAVWGSAFITIKIGLKFFPPVLLVALRYDMAGVVILTHALYATDSPLPHGRAEWTEIAIGAVFLIAAYHTLLFVGETDPAATSAAAVVTVSLSPVLTTGFTRSLLPGERLTLLSVIGLLLELVGVAVSSELDPNNLLAGGTVVKLPIFDAAMTFVLGSVLTHRVDSGLPIETMEAWPILLGAGSMHVTSVGLGEYPEAVVLNVQSVAVLAYLSLTTSALGLLIYLDLLARLGSIEADLVSHITPVFMTLSGWTFLSKVPTPSTVGGFVLIFLGFVLLKRGAIRHEPRYRFGGDVRATS